MYTIKKKIRGGVQNIDKYQLVKWKTVIERTFNKSLIILKRWKYRSN